MTANAEYDATEKETGRPFFAEKNGRLFYETLKNAFSLEERENPFFSAEKKGFSQKNCFISRHTGSSSPGSAFRSSAASSPRSSCQNAALPIIAALSVQRLSGGM